MKNGIKDIDERKLVLYLLDEISLSGRREVESWLRDSQKNRDEYARLERTWRETGRAGYFPREINVENAWEDFSKKIVRDLDVPGKAESKKADKRTLHLLYAAAAVVFLAWISITMVRLIQNDVFRPVEIIASNEARITDTLSDGSLVQLNELSTIKMPVRFKGDERKVELEGEAFFEVAPDSAKAFIVEAGIGEIRVLGTSFQVKAFPETDIEVYVEKGRVEISGSGKSGKMILQAGQRGIIRYPDGELVSGENIYPDDLFWANKKLIFEETRLSLVFELLRKHYESVIEVENKDINGCLLTAIFNNEEIDQILAVIAVSFDLTVEKAQDKFIIKGEGCVND